MTQMVNGFPRRNRIDLHTPAESAIRAAVDAVEAAGAHPLLTDAVILLGQAREKVADYVERVEPSPNDFDYGKPPGGPHGPLAKRNRARLRAQAEAKARERLAAPPAQPDAEAIKARTLADALARACPSCGAGDVSTVYVCEHCHHEWGVPIAERLTPATESAELIGHVEIDLDAKAVRYTRHIPETPAPDESRGEIPISQTREMDLRASERPRGTR